MTWIYIFFVTNVCNLLGLASCYRTFRIFVTWHEKLGLMCA